MHFFKFLVLVFGVCLAFTKAETEMKDEEQFMQDEAEEGLKEDTEEEPKMLPEEDSEEDTPKKALLRSLYLTMKVPANHNFYSFRTSYCFRRQCFVPGLGNRFLTWRIVYQSGYVAINNWIYYFWKCTFPGHIYKYRPTPTSKP